MNIKLFFVIFLMSFNSLFGGIEEYFKSCDDKDPDLNQMRNIDFIYLINLDQRPEKYESCIRQLHPHSIYPYRFSAVNGWELSLEDINKLGVKYKPGMDSSVMGTCYLLEDKGQPHHEKVHVPGRNYFCHCMSRGAVGIVLSHLSILYDAYTSCYDTIWVMEDDVNVVRDPNLISDLVDKLDALVGPEGWDVLFTDPDTKNNNGHYVPCTGYARRPNFSPANPGRFAEKRTISGDFKKVGARYGAYSMIVRRSGMKKILEHIMAHDIFLPYDMDFHLPSDIRLYALNYDLVATQLRAPSDNGGPGYKKEKP